MYRTFGKELLYSSFVLGSLLLIAGEKPVSADTNTGQQDETTNTVTTNRATATEQSDAVMASSTTVTDSTTEGSTSDADASSNVNTNEAEISGEIDQIDTMNSKETAAPAQETEDVPALVRTENYQDLYLQGVTAASLGLSNSGLPGWIISTINNGAISPVTEAKNDAGAYQLYDEGPTNERSLLGVVDNFSIFTFDSLKLSNITVNGRVAVGGNLTLTNAAIKGTADDYNLIVGGKTVLKINSSVNGRGILIDQNTNAWDTLWSGQKYTRMNTADFFASLQQQLLDEGNKLLQEAATGITIAPTSFNGNQLSLVGSGATGSDTEVFAVTTDQINATASGTIEISNVTKANGTPKQVIINVSGDNAIFSNGSILYNGQPLSNNKELAATITWNMPQTVAIRSSSFAQAGTIVAPLATFYMSNGSIDVAKLVVYKYNTTDINETTQIKAEFKLQNSEELLYEPINYVVAKGDVTNVGPIDDTTDMYELIGYSLDGGEMQKLTTVTSVPVAYRSTDQVIVFYYQPIGKDVKTVTVPQLAEGQKYYEVVTTSDEVEVAKQTVGDAITADKAQGIVSTGTIKAVDTAAPSTEFELANGQKDYEVVSTPDEVEIAKQTVRDAIIADKAQGVVSTGTIAVIDTAAPSTEFKLAEGQKDYEVVTTLDKVETVKQTIRDAMIADKAQGIVSTGTIKAVDTTAPSTEFELANGQKNYKVAAMPDEVETAKQTVGDAITADKVQGIVSTGTITTVDTTAPSTEFELANGQKDYEVVSTPDEIGAVKQEIEDAITADKAQGIVSTGTIKAVDTTVPSTEFKLANGQKDYEVAAMPDEVETVKQTVGDAITADNAQGIISTGTIKAVDTTAPSTEFKLANGQKDYEVAAMPDEVEIAKQTVGDAITADKAQGIVSTGTITAVDTTSPSTESKLAEGQKYYEVETESESLDSIKRLIIDLLKEDQKQGITSTAEIKLLDSKSLKIEMDNPGNVIESVTAKNNSKSPTSIKSVDIPNLGTVDPSENETTIDNLDDFTAKHHDNDSQLPKTGSTKGIITAIIGVLMFGLALVELIKIKITK